MKGSSASSYHGARSGRDLFRETSSNRADAVMDMLGHKLWKIRLQPWTGVPGMTMALSYQEYVNSSI